ncbi:MAG: hypothetical protein FJ354_00540 [Thaumarchaeota archaeon]|nr:hypothetical protein [Nitrososphaerota archaeon]
MGIFDKKPVTCTLCNKQTTHKHKAKKEWNMQNPLCTDCYMKTMEQYYNGTIKQKCTSCGIVQKITDLWEPRWQWDMEGLLCKKCFDSKEIDFNQKKEFCSACGTRLSFFRYNPKNEWKFDGQLCRKCWDEQKESRR